MKTLIAGKTKNLIVLFVFLLITLSFFVKLDYEYYFTDEILYLNSGREYILKKDYTLNLQHPFIAKYVVGVVSIFGDRNVFLLRLPFALMGAGSCFIVYLILKDYFGRKLFSLSGSVLYASSFYLFQSSRMSMMESPMHLFWLLTSLYFFRYLKNPNKKYAVLTGLFLGLSLASKFTSLTIFPALSISFAVYLFSNKLPISKYKNVVIIFLTTLLSFAATYVHLFLVKGLNGFTDIVRAIKDTILERNSEGKAHVIGDRVYSKSPWWFYLYYIKENYGITQKALLTFPPLSYLVSRNYFSVYWGVLFVTNLALFSLMSLKNPRYIASMELPAVFLTTMFLKFIYEKISLRAFYFIVLMAVLSQTAYLGKLEKTGYAALYDFIYEKTFNFSNGERVYILGSIRSSRWYFDKAPEDAIVSRKDFDVMGAEFPNFKYIVIEDAEEIKNSQNELSLFVKQNAESYTQVMFPGLKIYVKK